MKGIIPVKMNIWEYLQTKTGNLQAAFIKSHDRMIMDMVKSIQIGVEPKSGKPLYDTVWINENPFLKAYPINDESKRFTYALLPNDVVSTIEAKYAKYFAKSSQQQQDSIVRSELIKDCIRNPFDGIGKAEPLKGDLSGFWSRRIDQEHRLVYTIEEDEIIIIACRYHYTK